MSLATRCGTCGTVFRVVQDQLKVSEGWVRCGQCNEVFNALETLFDLERDTPPEWKPPESLHEDIPGALSGPVDLELPHEPTAPSEYEHVELDVHANAVPATSPQTEPQLEPHPGSHTEPHDAPLHELDRLDESPAGTWNHEITSTPAERIDERDRLEFPDARFNPETGPGAALSEPIMALHDTTLEHTPTGTEPTTPSAPEFMLHAQRRARWNGPGARIGLAVASVVLIGALAVQAMHQFRDTIAARWPETQPILSTWCGAIGCTIQPPRRIEDIAVESTSLTRAEGIDAFKLTVTLRNHGAYALALPSIDLSLTDAAGQLVARKMLAPKEWHAGTATIAASADFPLQLLLAADSARVTGYTVEVFYP